MVEGESETSLSKENKTDPNAMVEIDGDDSGDVLRDDERGVGGGGPDGAGGNESSRRQRHEQAFWSYH